MEQIQPGVYRHGGKIFTRNGSPGYSHYGEHLKQFEGEEYREWNPNRSKAAAAVMKGVDLGIERDHEVLYLGAASGTTVSHFSDILTDGFVVAVEFSSEVARELVELAERRDNIAPVIEDARKPEEYEEVVGDVDMVFQDISQSDQAEILLRNARKFGIDNALIAVKAQSISSSRDPEDVFGEVREKLTQEFEVVEEATLEPYETDHLFLRLRR
jgi:fibrillarin-like pre-rRNA processing protein